MIKTRILPTKKSFICKIIPQTLDNRYTDVVSLQCKVHESTTTTNSLLTIKTDKTVWQEM